MAKRIFGRTFSVCALCIFFAGCAAGTKVPASNGSYPVAGDPALAKILSEQCQKARVPAMVAAVLTSEGLREVAVVGFRKWGDATPATLGDLWHLGSDTKIMTATLAAMLVEERKLEWTSTVSDVFPELAASFNPQFRNVTLVQLLSHRAGLAADLDYGALAKLGSVREQRIGVVIAGLSAKPTAAPGSAFLYSNLGYIIVGAMIERVGGSDWESQMKARIFDPLGMASAGFGGLGSPGKVDQPWGHRKLGKAPGPEGADIDNPPVLGPAGRVHCSMQDWAKFIADQLRGARGQAGLLRPESYRELQSAHFPPAKDEPREYAFGWAVMDRDWAGGKALTHSGSNSYYLAIAWVAPNRDFAVLVCANAGLDAYESADSAIGRIIRSWGAHG